MPELDEFGIPIKTTETATASADMDEFGIPKKKSSDIITPVSRIGVTTTPEKQADYSQIPTSKLTSENGSTSESGAKIPDADPLKIRQIAQTTQAVKGTPDFIPEKVAKIPTVTPKMVTEKNIQTSLSIADEYGKQAQELQQQMIQLQPQAAKLMSDYNAELEINQNDPALQTEINKKYAPQFAQFNDLNNRLIVVSNTAKVASERARVLQKTQGIIDRNTDEQLKEEIDPLSSTALSASAQVGTAMLGMFPFTYKLAIALNYVGNGVNAHDAFDLADQQTQGMPIMKTLEDAAAKNAEYGNLQSEKKTAKYGTALEAWNKGDYGTYAKIAGLNFAEFVPVIAAQSALTAATGGAAAIGIMGAAFANQSYYADLKNRKDISESQKFALAWSTGMFTAASGELMLPIMKPLSALVGTIGESEAKILVKNTLVDGLTTGFNKVAPYTTPVKGAIQMYALGFGNALISTHIDPKFKDYTEEEKFHYADQAGKEGMGVGAFGGLIGTTVPHLISSTIMLGENKVKAADTYSKISEIDSALPTLDETMQDMLAKQKSDLTGKLNDIIKADADEIAHLSDVQKQKLSDLNETENNIKEKLSDENNPIEGEPKKVLEDNLKKIDEAKIELINESKPKEGATQEINKQKSIQSEREKGNESGKETIPSSSNSLQRENKSEEKITNETEPVFKDHDVKLEGGEVRFGSTYLKDMFKNRVIEYKSDDGKIKIVVDVSKPETYTINYGKDKFAIIKKGENVGDEIPGTILEKGAKIFEQIKGLKEYTQLNEIASNGDTTENGKIREVQEGQGETKDEGKLQEGQENGQKTVQKEVIKKAGDNKPAISESDIKNLENIGKENGLTSYQVRGIYNKYGEGKPLGEITPTDFKKAQEKQKFENHNKLAYALNQFNKLSPAKRSSKKEGVNRNKITSLAEKLGYEVKQENDGKLTAIGDSGKSVKTIGLKEDLPTPDQSQTNFALRVIDGGFLKTPESGINLDMSWADIRKGQKDLQEGKMTTPAKRLALELDNARKNGGFEYKEGTGADINRREFFVSFEKLNFETDHADDIKLSEKEIEKESKEFDEFFNNLPESEKKNFEHFINDNYENIDKGTESKTDVSDKKIASPTKSLADKIRAYADSKEIKLLDENGKEITITKSGFGQKEILYKIADLVEGGAKIIDAIHEVLKDQKWFISLTDKGKESVVKQFEDSVNENMGEGKSSKLRHVDIDELRTELGLEEIGVRERKSAEQLNAESDEAIKSGYNVGKLLDKVDKGHVPNDVEQDIVHKYTNILKDELENIKDVHSKEFDDKLNELDRITRQAKAANSEAGAALQAIQNTRLLDTSLASYLLREKDANNDAPLTDHQKDVVVKEFTEISQTQKDFEKRISDLESEVNALRAKQNVRKIKPIAKLKTHEEYVSERAKIAEGIKEKLKKFKANTNVSIIPYADQLIAISPDVAKLVKSHVDEKIDDLKVIVKNIHAILKDDIDGITEKDVQDIIAGVYNEKKATRTEDAKKLYELRQEAKLLNKIEDLQNGVQPKSERGKIIHNQKIEELRKQIRENDLTKISTYKTRVLNEISKVEQALKEGNYEPVQKKAPLVLDKTTRELKDKLIRLKQEREIRLMQQQYENRNRYERTRDKVIDILNIPRTLMSSMDYSAPLRQAVVVTASHPIMASKAGLEMFKQSVSQKRFDRWFHEVKEDPQFPISQQSGLYIADPHDPRLTAKEEMFMNNISEKIPVIGKLIKGSERAYVGYLNKMRWDLFTRFSEFYQSQGRTFENSPELFKGLASYVNNATGRGKIGALESAAPILNSVFFSPRLIASRINFLNPVYYAKLPKEVRMLAIKDVAKFVGLGMSVLALASLNGAQVETDPRSSDFGKIKVGNTRWDIWGGYQQYIRVFTQLMMGETKSASGKMYKLNGEGAFGRTRGDLIGNFVRGKLAPVPSMAVDFLKGRTIIGEPVTVKGEAIQHLSPLTLQDMTDAVKDKGISAIFTVGIPSTFGVGVQTYEGKKTPHPNISNEDATKIIDAYTKKIEKKLEVVGKLTPQQVEDRKTLNKIRFEKNPIKKLEMQKELASRIGHQGNQKQQFKNPFK